MCTREREKTEGEEAKEEVHKWCGRKQLLAPAGQIPAGSCHLCMHECEILAISRSNIGLGEEISNLKIFH